MLFHLCGIFQRKLSLNHEVFQHYVKLSALLDRLKLIIIEHGSHILEVFSGCHGSLGHSRLLALPHVANHTYQDLQTRVTRLGVLVSDLFEFSICH